MRRRLAFRWLAALFRPLARVGGSATPTVNGNGAGTLHYDDVGVRAGLVSE